jgi:SGNH domain (fused to AT3 domains)/Bacterial Ig domain
VPKCIFGDPRGTKTMAVVGDSHAQMWFDTINGIAKSAHWRLFYFAKSACPAVLIPLTGSHGGEYFACERWHQFVTRALNQVQPDLLLVSEEQRQSPDNGPSYRESQWRDALVSFMRSITSPNTRFLVLGNIPQLPQVAPDCLARHTEDVQACSASVGSSRTHYHAAEAEAAAAMGGRYIDPTPWFCTNVCSPVIGHFAVYFDQWHVMGPYALQLPGVLRDALHLPPSTDVNQGSARGKVGLVTHLSTNLLVPPDHSALHGTEWLGARASSDVDVSSLEFRINGPDRDLVVAADRTEIGWLAGWNTDAVPNGTYTIQSVAHDAIGHTASSRPVTVTVSN